MNRSHFALGVMLFGAFLLSGLYMKFHLQPQFANDLTVRMEARANHIYLLFVSLLNIVVGLMQSSSRTVRWPEYACGAARLLLLLSGALAIWAFLFEHSGTLADRRATFLCVVVSVVAVGLLVVGHWAARREA